MRAQRVREGESRAEMQTAKWTAEGTVKGRSRVFCDVEAYVSCRRYVCILQSAWATVNQGGTAGDDHPVLDRNRVLSGTFFVGKNRSIVKTRECIARSNPYKI